MLNNVNNSYYGSGENKENTENKIPNKDFDSVLKPRKSAFVLSVEEFVKAPKAAVTVLLLFVISTLVGALLVTNLFSGLAFFLTFLMMYGMFFFISNNYSYRFTTVSKILLPVSAFLFLSFAFNHNGITNAVTFLTAATVTLILLMDQSGLDVNSLKKMSLITDILKLYVERPLSVITSPFKAVGARLKKGQKMSSFSLVLIGIACTLPFVIVLILLFSSADEMFKSAFQKILAILSIKNIDKIVFSVIFGFFACIVSSAVFFTLCSAENEEKKTKEFSGKINAVAVSSFLSVLILLEAFFGYIQVRFLFLGKIPDGVGYAEYARSGFFQIAAATIITVIIILAVSIFVKRNEESEIPKAVKILLTVFSSCAVILFASAYFRMFMYMRNFGLSVKRVCVCWLMALMLTILIGIAVKIWRRETALFGWIVWSVVAFVIVLNVMRVDTLVAKYNVDRYIKNPQTEIDMSYLVSLSDEAVPQLEKLYSTEKEDEAKEAIEYMAYLSKKNETKNYFVNFSYSTYKANKVFEKKVGNINMSKYCDYDYYGFGNTYDDYLNDIGTYNDYDFELDGD